MTTWQFWTLIGVLVLNVLAVHSVDGSVKALWTKIHEVRTAINALPSLDYQEELARLGRLLERIEGSVDRLAPPAADTD
jgi:hypothetical protein